ncbi:ABC transporter, glutamate substrate-binding protein [Bifidobacterium magnum]|uniref:ABC transporter, glutamate substrate-binding protein n=1 Tax=Bifidobacterium magnum TaxID=1692 RepID=A0A087B6D6_9BIFI|nr:ABC transporter, glutamate substrate-binding protein [Bifidobacterium magnum]
MTRARRTRSILALLCALGTLGAGGCGTSISVVTQGQPDGPVIKIGVPVDEPSMGWLHNNTHQGFDVDVANYVADYLGYGEHQIEYVAANAASAGRLLADGAIEMAFVAMPVNPGNDGPLFAGPYLASANGVMVRDDERDTTGSPRLSRRQNRMHRPRHRRPGGARRRGQRRARARRAGIRPVRFRAADRRGGRGRGRPAHPRRPGRGNGARIRARGGRLVRRPVVRRGRGERFDDARRAGRRRVAPNGQGRLLGRGGTRLGSVWRLPGGPGAVRKAHAIRDGSGPGLTAVARRGRGHILVAQMDRPGGTVRWTADNRAL